MEPFDIAQAFMERSSGAASTQALSTAFQEVLERMGFRFFACCSHVNPARPPPGAVVLHTYPDNWARVFVERRLNEIDPVLLYAERTLLPFFWDAPAFRDGVTAAQQEILDEAAHLGLNRGFTIPIHMPQNAFRASCSVVPDSSSIDAGSYFAVQLMAMHLYDAACHMDESRPVASKRNALSKRQRQCLELAAQGKSDWAIGRILGISENTVHQHIEKAKGQLGVATRVQAIVRALQDRQISFGDAIRANAAPARLPTD